MLISFILWLLILLIGTLMAVGQLYCSFVRKQCMQPQGHANHFNNRRVCVLLLIMRGAFFVYCLSILFESLVKNGQQWVEVFRFFTLWNFTLLIIFFGMGTMLSLANVCTDSQGVEPGENSYPRLKQVHKAVFQVELPFTLFIIVVVWTILLPDARRTGNQAVLMTFESFNMHAANAGLMLLELFLGPLCIEIRYIGLNILWIAVYAFFHMVYNALCSNRGWDMNCNVYPMADTSKPTAPLWAVGLLALVCFFFAIARALSHSKGLLVQLLVKRKIHTLKEPLIDSTDVSTAANLPSA